METQPVPSLLTYVLSVSRSTQVKDPDITEPLKTTLQGQEPDNTGVRKTVPQWNMKFKSVLPGS